MEIPKFLLTDDDLSLNAANNYALHLFTSLFTIRANVMKWYLEREGSYDRLKTLPLMDSIEFFDCINSVIADKPNTIIDCVKWAIHLYNRIFIVNVKEANKAIHQTSQTKLRFPHADVNEKNSCNFILAATLFHAKMYDLKNNNGTSPTLNNVFKVFKNTSQSIFSSIPPYTIIFKKIVRFVDMMYLEHNISKNGVFIQHPDDLTEMVINPITPFLDDPLVKQFFESVIKLRLFNFTNSFSSISQEFNHLHRCEKFRSPYFRWSHCFFNLI